jgi:hypothetical protein
MMVLLLVGVVALMGQSPVLAATWTSLNNADLVLDGANLGNDYTRTFAVMGYNSPVGADKSQMNPCPQWLVDGYGADQCAALNFTTYEPYFKPVTGYGNPSFTEAATLASDGTLLDDLFASVTDAWVHVVDLGGPNEQAYDGTLDQDLDILFAKTPGGVFELGGDEGAHNANYVLDQSLDQQLAYWEGTGVHDPATDNGLTQRLVLDFAKINSDFDIVGASSIYGTYNEAQSPTETSIIDQWVVQWLRDIDTDTNGETQGIDQYYTQWFVQGDLNSTCADVTAIGLSCDHSYQLGHEGITKEVVKDTNHDHTP